MTPMNIPISSNNTAKQHSLTSRSDEEKASFAFNIEQYRDKTRWQSKQVTFKPESFP